MIHAGVEPSLRRHFEFVLLTPQIKNKCQSKGKYLVNQFSIENS